MWGAEQWSALASAVMAASAAGGAIAAFMGLNAWKMQQVWLTDHDLARKLLMSVSHFRDSIAAVRNPALSTTETAPGRAACAHENEAIQRFEGDVFAYNARLDAHRIHSNGLAALVVEADAVWGPDFRSMTKKLRELENEVGHAIWLHFRCVDPRSDPELRREFQEIRRGKRDIIYDRFNENDPIRNELEEAIKPIEAYLRGKLDRK